MIKRICFVISLLFVVGMGCPVWSQEQNKEKAAIILGSSYWGQWQILTKRNT
jgi:ABC-type sulfate transport system permease subunit